MSFSEFDKSMQRALKNDLELPSELGWENMSIPNPHEKKRRFGFLWFSWIAIGLVIAGGVMGQLKKEDYIVNNSSTSLNEVKVVPSDREHLGSMKGNCNEHTNVKRKNERLAKVTIPKKYNGNKALSTFSKSIVADAGPVIDVKPLPLVEQIVKVEEKESLLLKKPTIESGNPLNTKALTFNRFEELTRLKKPGQYELSFLFGAHISENNYSGEDNVLLDRIIGSERVSPGFSASLHVQRLFTKNIGVGIGFSHRVDHTVFSGEASLTPEFFYENGVLIRRVRTRKTIGHNYVQSTSVDLVANYRMFLGTRFSLEFSPIAQLGFVTGYRGRSYGAFGGIQVIEKDGAKEFKDRIAFNLGLRIGSSYQLTEKLRLGAGVNMLNQLNQTERQVEGIRTNPLNIGGQVFITRKL